MTAALILHPFKRIGPYSCACVICGWNGSTNALARKAHLRGKKHAEAEKKKDAPTNNRS